MKQLSGSKRRALTLALVLSITSACAPGEVANVESAPGSPAVANEKDSERLAQSRTLADRLGSALKIELEQALAGGGPTAAIAVCRDRAQVMAAEISQQSGANVGRTSLKTRNPLNAPEDWQLDVLREFARTGDVAAGGAVPEFSEQAKTGQHGLRYMRAIPTAPLCLTCHGRELSPEVRDALRVSYPEDRATGYEAGDIRGAFTVVWPEPGPVAQR